MQGRKYRSRAAQRPTVWLRWIKFRKIALKYVLVAHNVSCQRLETRFGVLLQSKSGDVMQVVLRLARRAKTRLSEETHALSKFHHYMHKDYIIALSKS